MSAIGQAISYVTGLFTPFTGSPTQEPESKAKSGHPKKPTEVSQSYFPDAGSRRSSVSSSTSSQESDALKTPQSQSPAYPQDPLSRDYPAPSMEVDVARQLALEPRQRSLHHSIKRAATYELARTVDDAETKAKKLAAAKARILALAEKA
ncbi:hypothetical protein JX265_002451 [Neoarthrinium moseri]|uniref:Uncharacterized protein n=1 Tax=Neoarthrinium moseri TaxID=1658444 RepID=A0A9P9WUY0_9PEZI|nr:uncharacterized protein JN550_000265 [Neoarthrinium moseri]KAI1854812.1 hypothetical protein JX266_000930 [Neoarthrinium moseri]KAI1878083.1 hypothetical protein JN550_000265 [Neoarthrinium moseri]KAI1879497.1 hypothetical protein JX265_002451 [Neoarthrinium moseri]